MTLAKRLTDNDHQARKKHELIYPHPSQCFLLFARRQILVKITLSCPISTIDYKNPPNRRSAIIKGGGFL